MLNNKGFLSLLLGEKNINANRSVYNSKYIRAYSFITRLHILAYLHRGSFETGCLYCDRIQVRAFLSTALCAP